MENGLTVNAEEVLYLRRVSWLASTVKAATTDKKTKDSICQNMHAVTIVYADLILLESVTSDLMLDVLLSIPAWAHVILCSS